MTSVVTITIDGPAGSGKSSVAKDMAAKIGFCQADSGAFYRTATIFGLEMADNNPEKLRELIMSETFEKVLHEKEIEVKFPDNEQKIYYNHYNLNYKIRDAEVTQNIKPVADSPMIRKWVNEKLQKLSEQYNLVVDGRDMGTEVFPDASVKFFLTASVEERARRRYDQIKSLLPNRPETESLEIIQKELEERDSDDQSRPIGTLKPASDAIHIDTTNLPMEEVIEKMLKALPDDLTEKPSMSQPPDSESEDTAEGGLPDRPADAVNEETSNESPMEDEVGKNLVIPEEHLTMHELHRGSVVSGVVIRGEPSKRPKYFLVDLNSKLEGIIEASDFDEIPSPGTPVEAIVQSKDAETGLLRISKKKLEQIRGMKILKEVYEQRFPIEVSVIKKLPKGYIVKAEGIELFLPNSLVGSLKETNLARSKDRLLGNTILCKILELDFKRKMGVVSRRAFQNEQDEINWEELSKKFSIGEVVECEIVRSIKSGVLVKLDDVIGFLHHLNISWGKNQKKSWDTLKEGGLVHLKILELDHEHMKLSFGLKQLSIDPWENISKKIKVADILEGTVSYITRNGAFVDLTDELDGFVPLSEMRWGQLPEHAKQVVELGDKVKTKVLGINFKQKKITLGIKQLQKNPWVYIRENVRVGDILESKIQYITQNMMFVEISDPIDGLIRQADVSWEINQKSLKEQFKKNQIIQFKVMTIDNERQKVSCSIKHLHENPYALIRKKYKSQAIVEGKIVKVIQAGLLVRLPENLDGLLHLNEIPKGKQNLKHNFRPGDSIMVIVKGVDPQRERISLSQKGIERAAEKKEMNKYIEKESKPTMNNPFGSLKDLMEKK